MQALLRKLSTGCRLAAVVKAGPLQLPAGHVAALVWSRSSINITKFNRTSCMTRGSLRNVVTKAAVTGQQPQQHSAAEHAFYAEAVQGFADLDLDPVVVDAIQTAGYARPSRVQELVIPQILSGEDIVLAAETGSGKTLAYIAPLASLLLQKAAAGQSPPAVDILRGISSSSSGYKPKARPGWMGLVLCPNVPLCHQVVQLVMSLQSSTTRQPILQACHVSSRSPPAHDAPDIVVTTPGALKTLFDDRGAMYGPQWTAEAVAARVAVVVVDEADLLCEGGYVKDLFRVLNAFKSAERRVVEAQVLQELDLDHSSLKKLALPIKQALWQGGVPAMFRAGLSQQKLQRLQQEQQSGQPAQLQQHPDNNSSIKQGATLEGLPGAATSTDTDSKEAAGSSNGAGAAAAGNYGPYFRRQHLFVAATMPSMTKGDVGTTLEKWFKRAHKVSGSMLHQVKPHVEHTWVAVGKETGGVNTALLHAIESDTDFQAGVARVLVFTGNVTRADQVSAFLHESGVSNHVYHKNLSHTEQQAALSAMSEANPTGNLIMVSTDAAARGIDFPSLTHVIQADFVANAVDFLHRVGRTARAGKSGKVTSLYTAADSVLADVLRQYVEAGEPLAECFSRNRSFSRKVKRYGKFVARGQEGPQ